MHLSEFIKRLQDIQAKCVGEAEVIGLGRYSSGKVLDVSMEDSYEPCACGTQHLHDVYVKTDILDGWD